MYLPLYIDIRGKEVLIIGMGEVGRRRAEKLLRAGAVVTAIDLRKLKMEKVKFIQKNLRHDNIPSLKKYFLVVASTDDKKLNEAIVKKARQDGCLVNRADLFKNGDVIFPAVVETGAGIISFATLGKNPKLSKRIKEALENELPKR
jgi:siroheme synthase-like protein